jgi:Holliday junction DNA helicase RuvA
MIDYIKGEIIELTPTDMVVECYGIGYSILISVQTYSALEGKSNAIVYIHHYLREDEELYYGFATKDERSMFRLLIGVSGIGAATARMMLSSLTVEEIQNAILSEDVNRIKSVKGIGLKSAQRMILELKDKLSKGQLSTAPAGESYAGGVTIIPENKASEAAAALAVLGYSQQEITVALKGIDMDALPLDGIIKLALRKMMKP